MIFRTPVIPVPELPHLFLKTENLQRFGSYKIRGVLRAVEAVPEQKRREGFVTVSAGNMAQAVASMARSLGVESQIYIPETAPDVKKQAVLNLGGQLIERPFDAIWEMVLSPPNLSKGNFIHPVFSEGLLAGYGEIALEILQDRPQVGAVVVPYGVGGLTLGLARAFKKCKPSVEVYACEPETAAPLHAALQAGRPIKIDRQPSFVDAIGTPQVLPQIFSEIQTLVKASLVIPLDEIGEALKVLLLQHKLVCEGAAATSFAAARRLAEAQPGREVVCILTGGNISEDVLRNVLRKALIDR